MPSVAMAPGRRGVAAHQLLRLCTYRDITSIPLSDDNAAYAHNKFIAHQASSLQHRQQALGLSRQKVRKAYGVTHKDGCRDRVGRRICA